MPEATLPLDGATGHLRGAPCFPLAPRGPTTLYGAHRRLNANAQYLAVGDFEANWNFATRSGTFDVTNFDGTDFAGAIDGIGEGTSPQFESNGFATGTHDGTQAGTDDAGDLIMFVNGSFFIGPNSNAEYMGGQGVITDTTTGGDVYRAITTFAAAETP